MNPPEAQDIRIICIGVPREPCGKEFVFTIGEQDYFRKNNLHQPKRCFNCRKKMREQLHGKES